MELLLSLPFLQFMTRPGVLVRVMRVRGRENGAMAESYGPRQFIRAFVTSAWVNAYVTDDYP